MNSAQPFLRSALLVLTVLGAGYFLLRWPAQVSAPPPDASGPNAVPISSTASEPPEIERALEIVTLLPRDAIPAIDAPRFYQALEADAEYQQDELILGVSLNGDSRAYSTSHLNRHEIVNDTVGGRKIAVTW